MKITDWNFSGLRLLKPAGQGKNDLDEVKPAFALRAPAGESGEGGK